MSTVISLEQYYTAWQAHNEHRTGPDTSMQFCSDPQCREAYAFTRDRPNTMGLVMALAQFIAIQEGTDAALAGMILAQRQEADPAAILHFDPHTQVEVYDFLVKDEGHWHEDMDGFLRRALVLRPFFNWLMLQLNSIDFEALGNIAEFFYRMERAKARLENLYNEDVYWGATGTARAVLGDILNSTHLPRPVTEAIVFVPTLPEPHIIGS